VETTRAHGRLTDVIPVFRKKLLTMAASKRQRLYLAGYLAAGSPGIWCIAEQITILTYRAFWTFALSSAIFNRRDS